jgi:hypothetical protein
MENLLTNKGLIKSTLIKKAPETRANYFIDQEEW